MYYRPAAPPCPFTDVGVDAAVVQLRLRLLSVISASCAWIDFCVSNQRWQYLRHAPWLQAKLSELVCMLEQKSGKMEILRFLTFRLDFNE